MSTIVQLLVRWTARITAATIGALFFAFVLGEPWGLGALRILNARSWVAMVFLFVAVVGMLVAWKWEYPAALISIFALAAFAAVVHINRYDVLIILAIPNLLYLVDWKLRRHHPALVSKAG